MGCKIQKIGVAGCGAMGLPLNTFGILEKDVKAYMNAFSAQPNPLHKGVLEKLRHVALFILTQHALSFCFRMSFIPKPVPTFHETCFKADAS